MRNRRSRTLKNLVFTLAIFGAFLATPFIFLKFLFSPHRFNRYTIHFSEEKLKIHYWTESDPDLDQATRLGCRVEHQGETTVDDTTIQFCYNSVCDSQKFTPKIEPASRTIRVGGGVVYDLERRVLRE